MCIYYMEFEMKHAIIIYCLYSIYKINCLEYEIKKNLDMTNNILCTVLRPV